MRSRPGVYLYYPQVIEAKDIPDFRRQKAEHRAGNYNWTVQTYKYLKDSGYDCELVAEYPPKGIVITHRDFLEDSRRPGAEQLLVNIAAEIGRHSYCQVHILQNPRDPMLREGHPWGPSCYIPVWRAPGLIQRDATRGHVVRNICYFGRAPRLAPQLRSRRWKTVIQKMGFTFEIRQRDRWNDYSNTDVVLAVRSFSRTPYYRYPATKLFNAWLAGVPAICGPESACQHEKKSSLDYIEVENPRQVLEALERLREDPEYYRSMIENGRRRGEEFTPEATTRRWKEFLETMAIPAYYEWCEKDSRARQEFLKRRKRMYQRFLVHHLFDRAYWKLVRSYVALKDCMPLEYET